ncbi:hypothetical protein [Haloarchaeobius sp. HRN-SO-5]|uniref:hypothetical protein n=1 Tax=Haloarchaeobius sp. HRN-SO-5 TaxID=3446118 RepID=UPI003EB6C5D2
MASIENKWENAPADPDPERDLEYRLLDVDVVTAEQYGQLLLLPSDDTMLKEDAFIVADEDAVVDLGEHT